MKIIFLKIYNLRKIEKTINDDTKLSAHDLELYARTLTKTRKVIACIIIQYSYLILDEKIVPSFKDICKHKWKTEA